MTHKTTAFFNRNCHDYGAQDTALRQRGGIDRINDFLTAYRNYYNRNGSMNLIVD